MSDRHVWATLSLCTTAAGFQVVTVDLSPNKWLDEVARLASMIRSDTSITIGGYERGGETGFLTRVGDDWKFCVNKAGRKLVAAYLQRSDREAVAKIRSERACRHDFADGDVCNKCDAVKAVA